MKLETTLEESPGFLHALPVFDLFILMTMLFLFGPMFLSQSGVSVELPESRFQMQQYRESLVVTLGGTPEEPRIHLGRDAVSKKNLRERLEDLQTDGGTARAIVLLKSDVGTPVGVEREVAGIILAAGFRLALLGKPAASDQTPPNQAGGMTDD